jgi:hypothetical protein
VRSSDFERAQTEAALAIRLVRSGALAAVVSDVPDDFVPGEEDVARYLALLDALLARGPVLPVQLGALAANDDAVREDVLDARHVELVRRLDRLAGLVEVRVRVDLHAIRRLSDTAVAVRVQLGARLLERLGGLAVAHAQLHSEGETDLRQAYLIAASVLPEFDEAVRQLRAELTPAQAMEYVGPLPPFDFTDVELEAPNDGSPRWGW